MCLPDQTPKLPKLPFLVGDAILLGVAWFIVYQSDVPLSANSIAAVTACVAVGALLGVVPFLTDYARKQDEALDDRQRGLEALARTSTSAAEQISIAANGLQEITDLLHRNLKHAEQLPHKLQEKIAEFNAQLDNVREDDREELEKELVELRASESERLQAIAEKIHRAVAELTKLDAATHQRVSERTEAMDRAAAGGAKLHADAVKALNDASAAFARDITEAQAKALGSIESRIAAQTTAAVASIEAAVNAAVKSATTHLTQLRPATSTGDASPASVEAAESVPDVAALPKRPRKSRREEPATEAPAAPAPDGNPSSTHNEPAPGIAEISEALPVEPAPTASEPAPIPAGTMPEVTPVVPDSAPPFTTTTPAVDESISTATDGSAAAQQPDESGNPTPSAPHAAERSSRKRVRKPASEQPADLTLELGGGEFASPSSDDSPVTTSDIIERVISSDGATRLIATAYIGIGNRLFIRGDGPGLSWEKGVPLQFVSIGKWRWETADASAPITVKLYKNDEIECSALGELTLDPGHQQEVAAKF